MSELLTGIPIWVLFLFFGLLYLGYSQTKTREVSRGRITLIPLVMLSLSLYGVLRAPHSIVLAVLAWVIGLRFAFSINTKIQHGAGVIFHENSGRFVVPGSWIPMMLLMMVFFAKFFLGFLTGSHFVNPDSFRFILISSCISGLISGTFANRALQIFQAGANRRNNLVVGSSLNA